MDRKIVSDILDEMGTLLELKGENPFRTRAYHNAAHVISALSIDLAEMVRTGTLTDIKGIGKGLAGLISEIVTTGASRELEALRTSVPVGLIEMLHIPGLGPKRIRIVFEQLQITTIDMLREACESGSISSIAGFGKKTELNILDGIRQRASVASKERYTTAFAAASQLLVAVRQIHNVRRAEIAGSLRRRKELVGDIDIIASVPVRARETVFNTFTQLSEIRATEVRGETKAAVRLTNGMQCDLRLVEDFEFPFALNYFTGSKEHNVEMRTRALALGWSLNEYGFSKSGAGREKQPPACKDEEQIYASLGLVYIPPELRENRGEFEVASSGKLPELVKMEDIRGTFHCHTNASDGIHSLHQMVQAAQSLGWMYLGIADHSQSAAYAGGLSPERVRKQWKEIHELNSSLKKFRIFRGTECDILSDGTLDFTDKLLAEFDFVVASIHSKFKMTESESTKRIIKALKNRYVTILGHPTGRLLLEREGYPVDLGQVISAASDYGKSIEINAHPMRLDLDWRWVREAMERGVKICINPDAHTIDGLRDVELGVGIARKGWLEAKDIVNTGTIAQVEKFFALSRIK